MARPKKRGNIQSAPEPPAKKPKKEEQNFDAEKRNALCIGFRETMRGLESDSLSAGLVCLSTCPLLLQQQLLMLVAFKGIPFIGCHDISHILGNLLRVKSVTAVGFKLPAKKHFSLLLSFISKVAPPVVLPWLSTHVGHLEGSSSSQDGRSEREATVPKQDMVQKTQTDGTDKKITEAQDNLEEPKDTKEECHAEAKRRKMVEDRVPLKLKRAQFDTSVYHRITVNKTEITPKRKKKRKR